MTRICKREKPLGYDRKVHKFGPNWITKTMKRQNLSVRKPTNVKKKTSVFQRFHKIHNYHHYSQFELANDPPSSESEGEDDDVPNFVY